MSDKYIIRNCPAFVQSSYKNRDWAIENSCELIDDKCCLKQNCVMKQIVELCKERSNKCKRCKANEDYQPTDCLQCSNDDVVFANDILQLLDIQDGQEIKGNKTIIFSKNMTPNNDFIDLYNVLKRNVEVLEEVERLLKQRSANK